MNSVGSSDQESRSQSKIHRVKFSIQEDKILVSLVNRFGTKNWNAISQMMKGRSPRQCRDRWNHYLTPTANTDNEWAEEEDQIIIRELKRIGKQWTFIASLLPGRTSIAVRNRSCKLSRQKCCDPVVKELLKDEYKKKTNEIRKETPHTSTSSCSYQSSPNSNEARVVFPSCQELMEKIRTPLFPPNVISLYGLPFMII